jgi:hypothetical protein
MMKAPEETAVATSRKPLLRVLYFVFAHNVFFRYACSFPLRLGLQCNDTQQHLQLDKLCRGIASSAAICCGVPVHWRTEATRHIHCRIGRRIASDGQYLLGARRTHTLQMYVTLSDDCSIEVAYAG